MVYWSPNPSHSHSPSHSPKLIGRSHRRVEGHWSVELRKLAWRPQDLIVWSVFYFCVLIMKSARYASRSLLAMGGGGRRKLKTYRSENRIGCKGYDIYRPITSLPLQYQNKNKKNQYDNLKYDLQLRVRKFDIITVLNGDGSTQGTRTTFSAFFRCFVSIFKSHRDRRSPVIWESKVYEIA